MFERFTDRARRVVVVAQEEARILNHDYIGTEHILLALISDSDGVAGQVLLSRGLSLESVRSEVEKEVGRGKSMPSGHVPFTPRAKKALELSLRESLRLGHNYIGTEHVLLGLIREGEGVAVQVLTKLEVGLSRLRRDVIQAVGSASGIRGRSPAVEKAADAARRLAGTGPTGSHHYLLAFASDETSMAAKVLASLGVNRQQIDEELARIDRAGTSDETPEEAGARRIRLAVKADRLQFDVEDQELVAMLRPLVEGGQIGPVIRGEDPLALGPFPQLWAAVRDAVHQLSMRAAAEHDEGGGAEEPRSADEGGHRPDSPVK